MATAAAMSGSARRVAVIAPSGDILLHEQADFIATLLARQHAVLALVPEADAAILPALAGRGLSAAVYPLPGTAPTYLAGRKSIAGLTAAMTEWRPHAVLACGLRSAMLGATAARMAGIERRVCLVRSLPRTVVADDGKVASWGWRRLLRKGLRASHAIVLHNEAQRSRLLAAGLLPPSAVVAVVAGDGVDITAWQPQRLPPLAAAGVPALSFLMLGRLDASNGAVEFCEAARLVHKSAPETRFVLSGQPGDIDPAVLAGYADCVEFVDRQADPRPLIAAAHVVVATPRDDGPPRALLEALAAGRPVIASDISGCREAVDERVNGVLIRPGDGPALAAAIMGYLKRPDLIPAMARASRSKAERRFDVNAVNAALLAACGL